MRENTKHKIFKLLQDLPNLRKGTPFLSIDDGKTYIPMYKEENYVFRDTQVMNKEWFEEVTCIDGFEMESFSYDRANTVFNIGIRISNRNFDKVDEEKLREIIVNYINESILNENSSTLS